MTNRAATAGLTALVGAEVLHELDNAYLTWAAAEIYSERALREWLAAPRHGDEELYLAYRSALNLEEKAAQVLGHLHRRSARD
jgi:hypothetical protein